MSALAGQSVPILCPQTEVQTDLDSPWFRSTILRVEVLRSARRHRVEDEDIQHGLRHALLVEEIGEDPTRYLVLGPDRAGNFLELVVLDRPQGPAVIHAMPMRTKYRRLLPPEA